MKNLSVFVSVGATANLTWSPTIGQFGGLDKLGPGCRQAAIFSTSPSPYDSSGVCPANALWGRRAL